MTTRSKILWLRGVLALAETRNAALVGRVADAFADWQRGMVPGRKLRNCAAERGWYDALREAH